VYDLAPLNKDGSPFNNFLGCGGSSPCTAAQLAAPSAVSYVNAATPPILIMHGLEDASVPIAQSQEFYDLLKSKGVRTEFIKVPNVGHSFLGPTADVTRDASRMALQKSLDFIDATIGDKAKH
jgi:dipeptidyl aminopeptidase/acylaminoacyl peptidase